MKSKLLTFWQARNQREKKVLIFCALFLFAVFLYAYVWQPGERARSRLHELLPPLRLNDARMHEQAKEIRLLRKSLPAPGQSADLKKDLDASAVRHKLRDRIGVLSVDTAGRAHLSINAIAFDDWIRWLDALQRENRLRLESSHIVTLSDPGMVKVEATLASADSP